MVLLVFLSCSKDDSAIVNPNPEKNTAPGVPELIAPANNLNCTDNILDFEWKSSVDKQGDNISYYIQIATNDTFSENIQSLTTLKTTTSFEVLKGVVYYWRVRAVDSKKKASEFSLIRRFNTEGDGLSNHLPYLPSLVAPKLNQKVLEGSVMLQWLAEDKDNDVLVYDVYFGTTRTPDLIAENINKSSYEVALDLGNTYYWKVVVRDSFGGETLGQLWSFQTE
ncbi:hypothetical protein KFZ70_12585 [Tamlana fucoidanivorans]|nr:hypothetical protein [Tamlana fucoidanivorans]